MGKREYRYGVVTMVLSSVVFSVMAALVRCAKYMDIDPYKTVLFRFATGLALLGTLALLNRIKLDFVNSRLLFFRGLFGGIAVFLYFFAISKIGLGKGTVISSSSPIFATIGSMIFLGEKSNARKWGLIVLAFLGIYLIAVGKGEDFSGFDFYEMLAITGAVCSGIAYVLVKKLRETDSPYSIFLAQCAIGFWLVIIPANLKPCQIGISGGVLLLFIGLTAALGQLLMTYAYKHVTVSTGSLLGMLHPVCNVVIAILIFQEDIPVTGIIGIVLVLVSCIFIVSEGRKEEENNSGGL